MAREKADPEGDTQLAPNLHTLETQADDTQPPRGRAEPNISPGAIVGRYVVISKVGAGAMGVVLAAYDPELDRKVALKLLKTRGTSEDADRLRLQREAQALAKLSHPNVVGVHDVGLHGEQVFVAMEFVAGRTFGEWIEQQSPSWKQIVEVMAGAGRGLAAAHRAGLVHRDLKPDNIMVDESGRARVMDFGLARADFDDPETVVEDKLVSLTPDTDALGTRLTMTGAVLGTPAYMSPEQFLKAAVDERSDQFSFCVTLWQALFGARPFEGDSVGALALNVTQGKIVEPPRSATAPAFLRRALRRGLSVHPDDRWPDMTALLSAIQADPSARRWRWLAAGAVAATVAAVTWGATSRTENVVCDDMASHLGGVWDEDTRGRVQASILGTKVGFAAETWPRVETILDGYTSQWVQARTQACEATQIRGERSAELMDRAMVCLDHRLDDVRALVDVFEASDETVVTRAVRAAAALPPLVPCSDPDVLLAAVAPPADDITSAQVEQHDRALRRARALDRAGKYDQALELAVAAVPPAKALGYPPLLVRALLGEAFARRSKGQNDRAADLLRRAYALALEHGMTDEAAQAAAALVMVTGYKLARHEQAHQWAVSSGALANAVGSPQRRANHLNGMGLLAQSEGKYDEAREYHERVLALRRESLPDNAPAIGISLNNLGIAHESAGRNDAARKAHEEAAAVWERALGPDHPTLATSHNNLGVVAKNQERYADAMVHYERARAIFEAAHGPDHAQVGAALHNLATLAYLTDDLDAAQAHNERARQIFVASLGPTHPAVATSLSNLALVAIDRENYSEALKLAEQAVEIQQGSGGDSPRLARPSATVGRALLELERNGDAIAPLRRAIELIADTDHDPIDMAEYEFLLARALWRATPAQGRNRDDALELAASAREAYRAAAPRGAASRARIDVWLANPQ